jgi:hypothetical protein
LSEYFKSLGLLDCWKETDDRITQRSGQNRLDRILYRLRGKYLEKLQCDWTFTVSDHCLLKLELHIEGKIPVGRSITLPSYILNIKDCVERIEKGLNEFLGMCGQQWSASMKLEFLKVGLRTVVGECIKEKNRKEKEELQRIQLELERRLTKRRYITLRAMEENMEEVNKLFMERNIIMENKSEALADKAKTKWFHEGERSNKYFLNMLRSRAHLTNIETLVTDAGTITDNDMIKTEISSFYKHLYEEGGTPVIEDSFFQNIDKIDTNRSELLTKQLTKEEIFNVLKTCKDSAPGPDGIPYSYYRKFWHICGDLIMQMWKESLEIKTLLPSHRSSTLRLLPKVGKDISKLSNWRPITLSNCDHKLITKCYANRLTNVMAKYLHPSQTAYLPGKQIQDNLRLINIVNTHADDSIIVSLDARKAFDSVNHDYIRRVLTEFGMESFVPIFDLLYKDQQVDISINGDMVKGYKIKNGVKQGDSLSCILFIMCIDPLIRNIENNRDITRIELQGISLPKIVAYADDITCLINDKRSLKNIFFEYERLSRASNLILNADKTEILVRQSSMYRVKYLNETHRIRGLSEAKINGIIFNRDRVIMERKKFDSLKAKMSTALTTWEARGLSLLGKILIYITFGLSQITYVLTIIDLDESQYKHLDKMFVNFLWGRNLNNIQGRGNYSRISLERLCAPIERGGFGMIRLPEVVEGIRCRQLGKMYNEEYNHPLKECILKEGIAFSSGKSLTNVADSVAQKAYKALQNNVLKNISKLSNDEILHDVLLVQQLGEIEAVSMIKDRERDGHEAMELLHRWNCNALKDIIRIGRGQRRVVNICRKIMKAKYLRLQKLFVQNAVIFEDRIHNKYRIANGVYKHIFDITSKEFRTLLKGKVLMTQMKFGDNIDAHVKVEYLNQVKRLRNTRHKNTLLRVWNGDCLSNSRLVHYGITATSTCPNCDSHDSPKHMLFECEFAKQVWTLVMNKIPKRQTSTLIEYALGINDSRSILMIKAEILKYIMHFRNLHPEQVVNRALAYIKLVNKSNTTISNL